MVPSRALCLYALMSHAARVERKFDSVADVPLQWRNDLETHPSSFHLDESESDADR